MSNQGSYIPRSLSELVTWSNNFATVFAANATAVGGTSTQATTFTGLNTTWFNLYGICENELTRSPANIISRNVAKKAMLANARMLVKIIQAYPGTTDTLRSQLKITIPDRTPTPIPSLTSSPIVEVDAVVGRLVKLRLRDPYSESRRKLPYGVKGVNIYTYVGATPPSDPSDYEYQGLSSRAITEVLFPNSVANGATIWVSACWVGSRGELGIGSPAISFTLQGGNVGAGKMAA